MSELAQLYPWHASLWQQLSGSEDKQANFPHALLISGIAGTGKKALAFYLAQTLMCHAPHKDPQTKAFHPCQQCRACLLFNSANHPDLQYLTTAEDKKIINVDRVRELIQWSVLSSQLQRKKVVIVEPADAMNQNAANSLLKTLEEPVPNTVLLLVSNKKQSLLPTIRSRCQTIDIGLPDQAMARQWLEEQGVKESALMLALASGAPLKARQLALEDAQTIRKEVFESLLQVANNQIDPVSGADGLFKLSTVKKTKSAKKRLTASAFDIIYWLDLLITDLARLSQFELPAGAEQYISNIDYLQDLQQLSNRLYLKKLMQLSDSVNKAYYEIQGSINLNLLFEKLLIDWKNCLK